MPELMHYLREAGGHTTECGLDRRKVQSSTVPESVACGACRTLLGLEPLAPKYVTVLEEADTITSKDRRDLYGHPLENFDATATLWNTYFVAKGVFSEPEIDSRDVGMLMILLKVARDANHPKRDSLVDIAGYARCCELLESDE